MKMRALDVQGTLYSSAGFRFGGFQTHDFLTATAELESNRPGVREEIVAEAYHTCFWLHRFPEAAFLVGALVTRSIFISLVSFVIAYVLEIGRFYLFGTSLLVAHVSRLWSWLKLPIFVGAGISLFPEHTTLAVVLFVFLVLQGYLTILTTAVMLPLRLPLSTWILRTLGRDNPHIHNMEAMALTWSINKRRRPITSTSRPGRDRSS